MVSNIWYERKFYLDKILKYLDNTGLIKVLIGQRRVWKSFIMKQIINFLEERKGVNKDNIIYINLEVDYMKYPTVFALDDYIRSVLKKLNWRAYLFFDEIQEIDGWEKLLNSYRADDNMDVDIFITWSNANLLSSELSTYLAGRYIDFEILPFSYTEYLWFHELENNSTNFLSYLNTTWISELYKLQDEESKLHFLKWLKDTVILKDIVRRYNIKDVDLLEKLFDYLASNIGNLFSLNSIVKKLKWLNITANTNTLGNYINYLEKTYILHSCWRYDIKWKRILDWEKKYYLNDLWFNNYFNTGFDIWWGRKLENLVYNHLRRTWYAVTVWNLWDLEIDFVAEKGNEKIYVQVAYLIADEKVLDREFSNLLKLKDNYPKYVVSMDEILIQNYEWIIHLNIRDFLMR